MTAIKPFAIDVPTSNIADLKNRLRLSRFPDKETPDDWSQGIPLAYVKEISDYWLNAYDWPARQAGLNRWPGFITSIQGLDIHFLHIKSVAPRARPLLLTHGWPGSMVEFQKVIGPLTDPLAHGGKAEDAFHLVCPSLPGFGFSGKPRQTGWGITKIATAWNALMVRLGYPKYFAQGGDWGAVVTTEIAVQDLGNCEAIHINMPIVSPDPDTLDTLTEQEQSALAGVKFYQEFDSGYSKQQSTRPQTLAYGLADSPIGQAAWIIEKFYQWMDCDGHPENLCTKDQLLDNVMLYWITNSAASSARIYWESFGKGELNPVSMPAGISVFPKEILRTSERWAKQRYTNLMHFHTLTKGGHFAAFEQPISFVDEVRQCFRNVR